MKRSMGFGFGVAVLCTTLFGQPGLRPAAVDSAFWAWKPVSLQGERIDLGRFRGKYILLDFWGEWCETCREETPFLRRMRERYPRNGLIMLGLLKTYNLAQAKAWVAENHVNWPQIELPPTFETYFAIQKFPTNLLIAPDGRIVMDGFAHHYQDFLHRMEMVDSIGIE